MASIVWVYNWVISSKGDDAERELASLNSERLNTEIGKGSETPNVPRKIVCDTKSCLFILKNKAVVARSEKNIKIRNNILLKVSSYQVYRHIDRFSRVGSWLSSWESMNTYNITIITRDDLRSKWSATPKENPAMIYLDSMI
jgi:hypothetical protein